MSTTLFLKKTESYIEMFFSISFYYRSSCIMQKKFKTIYFFTFSTYFYCEPHVLINIGYDIFSNCFYCTCFVYIYYILYIFIIYIHVYIYASAACTCTVHVYDVYTCVGKSASGPCGFEDWIHNPHFLRIWGLQISLHKSKTDADLRIEF